jgi:hypothetical protein
LDFFLILVCFSILSNFCFFIILQGTGSGKGKGKTAGKGKERIAASQESLFISLQHHTLGWPFIQVSGR